ncbi:Chorion class high-cysteine HCB protein 13, partial [Dysosmobacter welbionis]
NRPCAGRHRGGIGGHPLTEVISVRFRGGCKNYYFNPNGNQVKMGDQVIVETAQGPE